MGAVKYVQVQLVPRAAVRRYLNMARSSQRPGRDLLSGVQRGILRRAAESEPRSFTLDAAEMRNEADELVGMRLLGHSDDSGKGVYWLTEFGRAAVAMEGILRLSSAA